MKTAEECSQTLEAKDDSLAHAVLMLGRYHSQHPESAEVAEAASERIRILSEINASLKIEIQALKDLPPNYTYWGTEECDALDEISTDLILFREGKWDGSGFCNNGKIGGTYPAAVYRGTETHLKFFDRYF